MIKRLHILAAFLIDQLRKELEAQGHNNTGELAESLRYEIKSTSDGYNIVFYGKDYAKFVNNGIRSGKWVSVMALAKWVEERGIASGDKEIKAAAFAIRQKIYNEGSPTRGAFAFTSNGRRTEFVEIVFAQNEDYILKELFAIFNDEITSRLDNVLAQNKAAFLASE